MKQELSLPSPPPVTPCARLGLLTSAQLCSAHGRDHPASGSHWAPPQPGPGGDMEISVYDQH